MRRLALIALLFSCSLLAQQTENEKLKEQIQARVDSTLKTLCEMLEWKKNRDVEVEVLSRAQLEGFMIEQYKEELRPGEVEKITSVMVKFGVWKREWDLMKMTIKMLRKNVAGIYVPKKKAFYVMDDIARGLQLPMIVAHELTHALQDQNFDLWAFEHSIYANDDRSLAAHAVVEGQATLVGIEYLNYLRTGKTGVEQGRRISHLLRFSLNMQRNAMKDIPQILREMLIFPYEAGTVFYEQFCLKLGLKRSEYLFIWPPLSTEQILHPEKYLDPQKRDEPTEIRLLDPAEEVLGEKEYETIGVGVMGEFLIRVVLSHFIDEEDAVRAAAGWDGDRYFVIKHKPTKRDILFWLSTWDTENDAREFFDLYIKTLQKKYTKTAWRKENTACFWVDPAKKTLVWVERNGQDVIVVETATKKEAETLIAFAASASKVTTKRDLFRAKEHTLRIPELPQQPQSPRKSPQKGKEGEF